MPMVQRLVARRDISSVVPFLTLSLPFPDLYAMPFNPQFGLHFTKAELEELWTMMADEKEMRVRCHWEPEERESESEEEEDSEEMSDSDEPM